MKWLPPFYVLRWWLPACMNTHHDSMHEPFVPSCATMFSRPVFKVTELLRMLVPWSVERNSVIKVKHCIVQTLAARQCNNCNFWHQTLLVHVICLYTVWLVFSYGFDLLRSKQKNFHFTILYMNVLHYAKINECTNILYKRKFKINYEILSCLKFPSLRYSLVFICTSSRVEWHCKRFLSESHVMA